MINTINDMDARFGLMNLFKAGIISWTVLRDRDLYLQYDIYRRIGKRKMDSMEQTAEDFKVDFKTVQRAVKKMHEKNSNTSTKSEGAI